MVVDVLAQELSTEPHPRWEVGRRGLFARYRHECAECAFCLIKPLTFVNLSGQSMVGLTKIGIDPLNLTIVYDNLDLAVGAIKLKMHGGSGGHNGIASIIMAIGGDFARVAIGIGRPQHSGQVQHYVLSVPPAEEGQRIDHAAQRVCQSYLRHPQHSFEQRMEYLHRHADH